MIAYGGTADANKESIQITKPTSLESLIQWLKYAVRNDDVERLLAVGLFIFPLFYVLFVIAYSS